MVIYYWLCFLWKMRLDFGSIWLFFTGIMKCFRGLGFIVIFLCIVMVCLIGFGLRAYCFIVYRVGVGFRKVYLPFLFF